MFDADSSSLWQLSAEEAVKAKLATAVTERFDAPPIEFVPADSRNEIQAFSLTLAGSTERSERTSRRLTTGL